MNENNMITIPMEEYKKLVEMSIRVDVFADYVKGEEYSISRKKCGIFLGFEVSGDDD